MAQGIRVLRRCLPQILEDGGNEIEPAGRRLLAELREELVELDERISALDARLSSEAQADERCRRLQSVPGIGPLIATALVSAVGDAHSFGSGRHLAAWLGLVPKQHTMARIARAMWTSRQDYLPAHS